MTTIALAIAMLCQNHSSANIGYTAQVQRSCQQALAECVLKSVKYDDATLLRCVANRKESS